jgi:hypothetical protein
VVMGSIRGVLLVVVGNNCGRGAVERMFFSIILCLRKL